MKKAFVVGKTKTFFRAGAMEYLEANRSTGLDAQAIAIQKYARGYVTRKRLKDLVTGASERAKALKEQQEKEAQERREKFAREKAERDVSRKKAKKEIAAELDDVKRQMEEAYEYKRQKMQEVADRKAKAEEEIEALREQTSEEARKALMEPKKLAAQQKKKIEENTKLIEYLKKENKKIRKDHDKIKSKYDVVKSNNDKLIENNESTGDNFDDLNETTGRVHQKNEDLTASLEKAKKDNKKLKEKCMGKQEEYMTQAETRLEYQKTMARILNMIQDQSKEQQLVEDTVVIALECEAEAKAIMAALEAETGDGM